MLLKLLAISAPLFFLRLFDTSFTLFDGVLLLFVLIYIKDFNFKEQANLLFCSMIFLLVSTISIIYGVIVYSIDPLLSLDSFARYSFFLILMPIASSLAIGSALDVRVFLTYLLYGYFISSIINTVGIALGVDDFFDTGRATGLYGNANWLGYVSVISLSGFLWQILFATGFKRILASIGILSSLYNLFLSGSNSAVMLWVCCCIAFFMFVNWRVKLKVVVCFLITIMSVIVAIDFGFIDTETRAYKRIEGLVLTVIGQNEVGMSELGSANERLELILSAFEMIKINFIGIVGYGLGQTPYINHSFGNIEASVHLNLLGIWLESGLISLVAYFMVLTIIFDNIAQVKLYYNDIYVISCVMFLLFFLIGMFTPHVYLGFFVAIIFPALGGWAKNDR